MNNPNLKLMLMAFAVALAVSHAPAQGYLICPLPDASPTGGTTSPFNPSWNTNLATGQKIIPIVFHLIGTSASLQDIHIQSALNQLNADFNSPNLDWDIEFRLAGIGPRGECATGITRHPGISSQDPSVIKAATRWDNTKYLNVWVLPLIEGDPLKWGVVSAQPSKFQVVGGVIQRTDVIAGTNAAFDNTDGVVIKEELINPNPAQIHTLAHEVGHWLNLLHTFAPCDSGPGSSAWNCCHPLSEGATNGDFIADTPPQQNDFGQSNCSLTDHYCSDGEPEDLSSFMGYAFSCQNKFTQGQREWMFHCLLNFRPFIWSAASLRCAGVGALSNVEITQPTDWNFTTVPTGFVTITNELRIKNGGILNIAPGITVQFCDAAKAIVEPGGNVQLFGTLTSACQGRMWQGVEVQGTPASNQFGGLQGRFKAHPNSLVSNAILGVKAGDAGFGLGGGIVQCTLATFRNNQRAVQFNPYENHLPIPGAPVTSNASYFIQCEFLTGSDYPGYNTDLYLPNEQVPFSAFADLLGVRGIRFLGCNFINETSHLLSHTQYGIGILSKESSFSVGDYCTGISLPCPSANQDHCLFKNLYNDLRSLYLSNPTGPDAQTQMSSMTALQEIIQGNTFDILTDILANETGTLSDYRYWLGNMDAYETDLEIVRSYIGTAELSAAVAKLNAIPSKYQLSGDLSAEFNQYQALLGIVNQHYQAGGNKYSFSTATLSTFQVYAENSPHARVRGLAKQILAIYGITYPPEPSSGFGGGGEERQGGQSVLPVKRVQLVPNPANQTVKVQVDKNLANADIAILVTVVSTIGATVIERNFNASSEYFDLDISELRTGVYYVWVRLGSGESFVHPLSVVR